MAKHPHWIPIAVDLRASPSTVTWADMGERRFAEPFFQQTVECHLAAGARVRTTGVEELLAADDAARTAAGFIFHMSRCGSTAVANALRALRGSRVIAEAPALNQILAAPPAAFGSAGQLATLRAAVRALGGRAEESYFVKFSSWNVLYLPLVHAAFPGVPWVFVYRHPVEVMVANLAKPGRWMRAQAAASMESSVAAAVTGLDPAEVAWLAPDEYCARALANFCRAALGASSERRMLVNHRDLSPALLPSLLAFFGRTPSQEEQACMADSLRFDAKHPAQGLFAPDTAARQAAASPRIRTLAEAWVMEPYEQLERERFRPA